MDAKSWALAADRCLEEAADWLEDFDPDEVDFIQTDGVLKLEFADGARFVLSRQSAAKQMWLAAGASAWHFNWDGEGERWVDAREGPPLFEQLAGLIGERIGRPVSAPGA